VAYRGEPLMPIDLALQGLQSDFGQSQVAKAFVA